MTKRYLNIFTRKIVTVTKHYQKVIERGTKKERFAEFIDYTKDIPTMYKLSSDTKDVEIFDFTNCAEMFFKLHVSLKHYNSINNSLLV